ncbi:sulfatase [Spongiimicrobium sp. 3-5]|uniref:sulfatase family protein n=1 Tax=Spongiimicrobium sp. 3-5 TaxID=3332596 RepID=UPI00397FA777
MKAILNSTVGFLLILLLGCTNGPNHKQVENQDTPIDKKTNFIIIFADDLGYGDLGVYGHPTINTPNLDKMASEGQKWTSFYVGASVCTPSRAALLTGRLPVRSGMASPIARVLFPNSHNGLPKSEITLAEQLKSVDYATAIVGKWHLGHKEEFLPTNHGFDYYFGIPYSNDMDLTRELNTPGGYWDLWTEEAENLKSEDFNVPLIRNTEIVERPADQTTITRRFTEESIKFIKENKEKPFFLYLAHNLPHVPLFASEEFLGKSRRGLYGDVVEEIDHGIGRILNYLREEGLAENTIVVFTSDNGPWLPTENSGGTAGLLKDGKGSTWEGGMREPGIFWSPGKIKPKVVMDMGTTMDLFTTFSAIAGVPIPNDRVVDGLDLSPVLFEGAESPRNAVYYYRGDELYAIRVGAYKAHFITEAGYTANTRKEHHPPLLYNVEIDPSERFNISADHPDVIARIENVVKAHEAKMVKGADQLKDRG